MLTISDEVQSILAGSSWQVFYRLQSWRADEVLAEDIPAVEVLEEGDASLRVPERLTFKVPVEVDGVSWVPVSYNSPLGCYGQKILAQIGVGVQSGSVEWLNRGMFLLESAESDGFSITVEAVGLLQLLDEAELATEFQPTTNATLGSTLRQLIEPGLTVNLDQSPPDRKIPASAVTWSDNRLDCVYTVLDAWPARGQINVEGHLEILEEPDDPVEEEIVFFFSDDTDGTVVSYNSNVTRDGAYNSVIAEGVYADDRGALAGLPIVHIAIDADTDSPYSLLGEFSQFLVPYKFQSPLLNEHVATYKAAFKKLKELRRKASRTVELEVVPNPAMQLGDVVAVTSTKLGLTGVMGRIDAFSLPYSADGGAMRVTVRLSDKVVVIDQPPDTPVVIPPVVIPPVTPPVVSPPTRVQHIQSAFNTGGASKTSSTFDVNNGDVITIIGYTTWYDQTLGTPTWTGSGTVTLRESKVGGTDQSPNIYLWTIAVTATATGRQITVPYVGYQEWGFTATVWRNHGGIGDTSVAAPGAASAPSLNLSVYGSSAVESGVGDTFAIDGTTRTWRTINGSPMTEQLYARVPGNYTVYGGYRSDAGTAGTVTTGLTTPSTMGWASVAVEILSGSTTPTPPPPPPPPPTGAWLSGASSQYAANGTFGTWRNKAIQIGGTWMNDTSLPNLQPGQEWGSWTGPMDVALVPPTWTSWAHEASGGHDSFWTSTFANLATLRAGRGTTYVRMWYEFNGTWMDYTVHPGEEGLFKTAWNRIAAIARAQFPGVKLLLGSAAANGVLVSDCWPTAAVDGLSIDFYNNWPWVTTQAGFDSKIETAAGANSLEDLRRLAESKGVPIAISEWSNQGAVRPENQGGGGESPPFIDSFYAWCVAHAGTGPGQLLFEVLFNLWPDQFELFDGVGANALQPNTANQYKLSTRFGA